MPSFQMMQPILEWKWEKEVSSFHRASFRVNLIRILHAAPAILGTSIIVTSIVISEA